MIAMMKNDVCYSTALGGDNPFNTDGKPRTELSLEEARTAFGFELVKKPSYDSEGRRIPKHWHLVRDDDNEFVPTASLGEKFTPVQHRDIFDYVVNDIMPQVPQLKLEMAGTMYGGGMTLIAAQFGDAFTLPGDKSEQSLRLFISNPTNGSGRMTVGFTHVRVICQNTLLAATKEANADGWRVKHTPMAEERLASAISSIKAQACAAIELKKRCEWLAGIGVDTETVRRVLDAVYPIERLPESAARTRLTNLRDEVVRQFESGETAQTMETKSAWALFNSFTYGIFNPEKIKKGNDIAQVQFTATAGYKADRVKRIFNTVAEVVA